MNRHTAKADRLNTGLFPNMIFKDSENAGHAEHGKKAVFFLTNRNVSEA